MNEKTLKMLEFQKIIDRLTENAVTYLGKEKCEVLQPSSNMNEVSKWQKETAEASSLILKFGNPPISRISDYSVIAQKIRIGGVLSILELLNVANILKMMRELKGYFEVGDTESYPIVGEYFEQLYSNLNVEKEIYRCMKSDEELDDRASTELYNIRRHIVDAESRIKDKLNDFIHGGNTAKFLQEQLITIRNDRYVIPVKAEYKNEIKGFVHDSSASGSTLFIEPSSIFNINNEIKDLKIKEQLEIQRILSLLTQMVDPISEMVEESVIHLANIDFAFAKANLALKMDAYEPKLNDKHYIHLKKARHPLIDSNQVVPIDIIIGDQYQTLVITGPNTGGKTVTLKTVGLFTLMAQSGLHIPALESSEISVFENIYADIGDEQSIEQSLSTFSSHMKNVIMITGNATKNDLILLDELGSGTDPVEGAAIAMAVLEYLKQIKSTTIATTHYSELKSYAIQEEGVENASCEFDVETLRPTYKLLIGVPGKSNAFAISKKLGLSEKILEKANTFLSTESIKFEEILGDMEHDRMKAREQKEVASRMLSDAKIEKEKLEQEIKRLEDKKEDILQKAKKEARDILLDAESEANDIIKELTSLKKSKDKNVNKSAEEARSKLKRSISEMQKDLVKPKKEVKNAIDKKEIKVGMKAYLPSLDQEVSIVSLPDKKDNVIVQAGIMKLTTHISQLEKMAKEEKDKADVKIKSMVKSKARDISTEIMLLGMTVDEAVSELEKYLDDAYLAGIKQVRVVHGKGSGSLRRGVTEYLRSNPHVASFRLGMYGEGDSGVTIVELK
ncbi:MAG: endonuclease MutS2 [Clostridia bacterium]|nr:endonuclease MutS2 [Clostridia bacterium]